MRNILVIVFLVGITQLAVSQNKFEATPKSLQQYQIPEWYKDAKIGYWCTWGIYSIPAYGGDHAAEWYGRWMYTVDDGSGNEKGAGFEKRGLKTAAYHKEKYGSPDKFGYKDFIPMFKAEKWNADDWADLFAEGGARFFMFMAMHHDNYCLWNSETQPYNSVKTGPKRDFTAEMKEAVKKRGMYFGVSNHSAWNGSFFEFNRRNGFDGVKDEYQALYGTGKVDEKAIERWWKTTIELADKYRPDLYYFDWCWNLKPFEEQHRLNFLEHYYNKAIDWGYGSFPSPGVAVNYKSRGKLPEGSAVLDLERGGMSGKEKYLWQNDTSLGLKSWSYDPDEEYRSPDQVVDMLMDIISKNGVLLLNVGPKADGTIPPVAQNAIREVGKWLKINGEAVYATRPWDIFGEGPTVPNEKMHGDQVQYTAKDIRFTRSKDNKTLFATFLGYPGENALIPILHSGAIDLSSIKEVVLLMNGKKTKWKQTEEGMHLEFPKNISKDAYAYAVKITFENKIPSISKL